MKFLEKSHAVFIDEMKKFSNLKTMYSGTMNRSDYWHFQFAYVAVIVIAFLFTMLIGLPQAVFLVAVPLWIPHIATQIKRTRDIGFWIGTPMIQFLVIGGIPLGMLLLLALHCLPTKVTQDE